MKEVIVGFLNMCVGDMILEKGMTKLSMVGFAMFITITS
jgi:hypothetical protein